MFIQKPFSLTSGTAGEAVYVPAGAIQLNGTDEYLHRTPSSTGTPKVQTFSFWAKINEFTSGAGCAAIAAWADDSNHSYIDFNGGGEGKLRVATQVSGGNKLDLQTSVVFRDPTAWYHWCVIWDFTNNLSSERGQIYRNGVRVSSFGTETYPATSDVPQWATSGTAETIGIASIAGGYWYADIYLSDFVRLDGYAALPSDFATENSNGLWVPKDPTDIITANKGTNGFWLDFADSSDLGNDVSSGGTDNSFTSVNMGTANSVLDRPADDAATNVGNYWTLSPLAATDTLTNGNLSFTGASNFSTYVTAPALPMTGKWYYEVKATGGDQPIGTSASYDAYLGLVRTDIAIPTGSHTSNSGLWVIANWNPTPSGQKNNNSTATYTPTTGFADGSIIMVAVDLDNNAIWFGNDGTWAGSATASEIAAGTTTNAAFTSSNNNFGSHQMMPYQANYDDLATYNFGATAFAHTPPTGFKALNTANLSEPTVKNGENNFLPMIYEGNGGGQRIGNFIPFTDSHTVANSCLLKSESSQYLSLAKGNLTTPTGGTSSGNQKFTLSFWLKLTKNNNNPADGNGSMIYGTPADSGGGAIQLQWAWNSTQGPAFNWTDWSAVSGGGSNWLRRVLGNATTTAGPQGGRLMLDYSQWHHYVIAADWTSGGGLAGTDACAKIYIDGQLQTLFLYDGSELVKTNPAVTNFSGMMSDITDQNIGWYPTGTRYGCFYIAEVVGVDGQQLAPSVFGETDTSTNRWIPKDPTSTLSSASDFGNNGFYLNMASANDLGNDVSGNGNDWTMNNMDTSGGANQIDDTPTQNYSTMNPNNSGSGITLANGNLKASDGLAADATFSTLKIPDNSGKWYWEMTINAWDVNNGAVGIIPATSNGITDSLGSGSGDFTYGIYTANNAGLNGYLIVNGASGADMGDYAVTDRVNVCYDSTNHNMYLGKNGTYWGSANPSAGTGANITGILAVDYYVAMNINPSTTQTINFGATSFTDSVPTDAKHLNQDNLAENTAGITGFSWIKNRDATDNHILQDRVRGVYNYLSSNNADLEATNVNSVKRFLQQGVQVGNMDAVNTSAESYVLWQWAANGTGTVNEEGSIDSTISANIDAGFSVVKYTGTGSAATVGHGLSSAPTFILNKTLGSGSTDPNWQVYHVGMGATKAMFLNTTGGPATSTSYWNDTTPTADVFSIGTDRDSATDYINYCWTDVEGYSKFGTYIGNNSSDGPVVYLGFKPAWIMIKALTSSTNWNILDSTRNPFNSVGNGLRANGTVAEFSGQSTDFLSTGFKLRLTGTDYNTSGQEYMYASFASNPFGGDGVGQARAR